MSSAPAPTASKRKNRNRMGLTLGAAATSAAPPQSPQIVASPRVDVVPRIEDLAFSNASQRKRYEDFILQKETFTNSAPYRGADFERVKGLGAGQGGVVMLCRHTPTGLSMARKLIHIDIKPEVKKQIERELKFMHECNSPNIVGFYGSFIADSEINILMEQMDCGSLDAIIGRVNRIPELVCGTIAQRVVTGLLYLLKEFKIIHRDVKPSNILVNSAGEVKICDFGVSGSLEESLLMTFVGTRSYMAPERLEGLGTTASGDVWSLGLTMVEAMVGTFPIPPPNPPIAVLPKVISNPPKLARRESSSTKQKPMSIFETLAAVVEGEAPRLPEAVGFSPDVQNYVTSCCEKDPTKRASLDDLLTHRWMALINANPVNMTKWALSTIER